MTTIEMNQLATTIGGAATTTFAQSQAARLNELKTDYQRFVCKSAGYQGGEQLATTLYGTGATDDDKERGVAAIQSYCLGGGIDHLPAAAPAFPLK